MDQRTLSFGRAGDDQSRTIALGDISRLEKSVQRSRKKKGALVGLGVGFAVGFAGTAILGGLFGSGGDSDSLLVWGSIYGAAVAPVGAIVGGAVAPGEQWAEVSISHISSGHVHGQRAAHSRITIRPLVGRHYGLMLEASF